MARKKISEYRSKLIVNKALGLDYIGWEVLGVKIPKSINGKSFVVKVDQAIKKRFKKGLIFLDIKKSEIRQSVEELQAKGFSSALIEPYFSHEPDLERYISLRREREGVFISYSSKGGIDIESNLKDVVSGLFDDFDIMHLSKATGFPKGQLVALRKCFDDQHMSLLEINPYVVYGNTVKILDTAIEVDSSAELLVDGWSDSDYRAIGGATISDREEAIRKLNSESPASFSLDVINKDGGIWLLLSGGGASVVIADEIFTMGYGDSLANYGEYSGNPSEYETEYYTEQVVSLLIESKSKNKVVLIGGAVANFTDIKTTFKGIINVLYKYKADLQNQGIKFYVRRGGPRQAEGLSDITKALTELNILGGVYDPSVSIPSSVSKLIGGLK